MRYGDDKDDFDDYGPRRSIAHGRDADREGGGYGSERDDQGRDEGALMTMTRRDRDHDYDSMRDTRDLYRESIGDMQRFLRERETAEPEPIAGVAVTLLEVLGGAAIAGFLAQRFRQMGAVVPVGLTVGALGLAAAQFNKAGRFSPDLRNVSYGALASAVAIWAAGRGIISADAVTFGGTATAGLMPAPSFAPLATQPFAQPQPQPQMFPQQPPQPQMFQQSVPMPVPMTVPPMVDFHNLVMQRPR